jgi:nucleotide-binding universal stress UspA family protein
VHTDVVADGQPARAIVDYAEHHDIDLIAMTTHGRGALKRLVAGSVSEGVIRTSSRPMLVLRPKVSE